MIRKSLLALSLLLFAQPGYADTLKRIQESGVVRIGYRADAHPHSYRTPHGTAAGYIVDICRDIVTAIQQHLQRPVKAEFVLVNSENRFTSVRDNKVDLLCEPSTVTMSRREIVDFSIPTFIDGAGVAYRGEDIESFEDFSVKRVGVLSGTTNYDLLRSTLEQLRIAAEVTVVKDHRDGIRLLADGKLDAYFADRTILAYLYSRRDAGQNFKLGSKYFSYEPYALALQRNDAEFRWLVDRTLARFARTGRIEAIAQKSFGTSADEVMKILISINSIPD